MSRFLETICVRDGQFQNLIQHARRIERTRQHFFFQQLDFLPEWEEALRKAWQAWPERSAGPGRVKCRLLYGSQIESIEFVPYRLPEIRTIELIEARLDYSFKYADRTALQALVKSSMADDILICHEGWLQDTSFCNVALFDGRIWVTPEAPLLAGTRRAKLIAEGQLETRAIHRRDLPAYSRLQLFNAMIEPGELELVLPGAWREC